MKRDIKRRIGISGGVIALVGVILSPVVASAASQTANTTINATLNSVITISTSGTVAVSLTPTSGGVVSSNSDTVTVSTNDTLGYTLTLADSDANTNLVSGSNNITASTGTQTTPIALASNTWGYAVAGVGGFNSSYATETNNGSSTSKWAGMPATGSPNTLKTTSTTASGDTTAVWYGVEATTSQPAGTYTDQVTYTATTN